MRSAAREAIGNERQNVWAQAESEMRGTDLDVLDVLVHPIDTGLPGDHTIAFAVDGGYRDPQGYRVAGRHIGVDYTRLDPDTGGLQWIDDMLELLEKHQLNYTFHSCRGENHGIYPGNSGLPKEDGGRSEQIALFRRHLQNRV